MSISINHLGSSMSAQLRRDRMGAGVHPASIVDPASAMHSTSGSTSFVGNDLAGAANNKASTLARDLGSPATGESFADTMKQYLSEVTQLQREASGQVEKLVTGQTDDLVGVMTAIEKSDLAFRTLLAIRTKLMDAYNELRNLQI